MMKKSGELLQNTLIPFLKGTFDNYQEEHQIVSMRVFLLALINIVFVIDLLRKHRLKRDISLFSGRKIITIKIKHLIIKTVLIF